MPLENPEIVQTYSPTPSTVRASPTPIFLIHDGGGTCFAYHCLSPISRPVFGIHNPNFESGEPWAGGIPEMARLYVDMVREAVASPDFPRSPVRGTKDRRGAAGGGKLRILLGGWSLGGMLSLEMASLLMNDPEISVAGIVMMDTVCPIKLTPWTDISTQMVIPNETKTRSQELARQCMRLAIQMVTAWTPPPWSSWSDADDKSPPQTVLIRAKESVPRPDGGTAPIDANRRAPDLGWARYHPDFLSEIIETDGHHFSMFGWDHLNTISEKLRQACDLLDTT